MTGKSISFRAHLVANTLDLLAGVGLNCAQTAKLIAGLVSQLAAYTEEGVPMTPAVFVCSSIEELVRLSGSGEFIPLSGREAMDGAAAKILKAAASLCGENWRVYVERAPDGVGCKYGVFCGTTDPSALTVEEIVLDDYREGSPIIRIAQSAVNKVEVRTSSGGIIEFRFNDDIDVEGLENQRKISQFAQAITGADEQFQNVMQGYVDRLLSSALRKSHGTLLAVVSGSSRQIPQELEDCIKLDPPISLAERLQAHLSEGRTSTSVSRLQVATDLVGGFVSSDGITVFNSVGEVIAYRAFIHGDPPVPVNGGARSRAFAVLKSLVGNGLDAAFFRSQDGRMDVQVVLSEANE